MEITANEFMRLRKVKRDYDLFRSTMINESITIDKWFAKIAWRLDDYERIAFMEIITKRNKNLEVIGSKKYDA